MTALITGRTSGIGRAVANKLAQLGIHAVVVAEMRNAVKRRLLKFEHRASKRISFRPTFGMLLVPAKSRVAQSNSETAMSMP
jgi:NAD(P)-dependent dehydrogenase (short-subunit alcohol dehydrogenase family)